LIIITINIIIISHVFPEGKKINSKTS